jgi:HAD superfamily phosphatase
MDGVLVDAEQSYRQASLDITSVVLANHGIGGRSPDLSDVALLKRAGGFNNDWDLTEALICIWAAFDGEPSLSDFAGRITAYGGGPSAVTRLLPQIDSRSLLGTDELCDTEVRRRFQELYLGSGLFRTTYGQSSRFPPMPGDGYIDRELPLAANKTLPALAGAALGVVTGRPRAEAAHAISRFNWEPLFDVVVTHDDVLEKRGRFKPEPWPLTYALEQLGGVSARAALYLGDQPDDMRAAAGAGVLPVGCSGGDPIMHDALVAAGAQFVVETINGLPALLRQRDSSISDLRE